MRKKKRIAAFMSVILICVLLITELPRIINAAGLFGNEEQTEVLDETDEEKATDGEEPQAAEEQLPEKSEPQSETADEETKDEKAAGEEDGNDKPVKKGLSAALSSGPQQTMAAGGSGTGIDAVTEDDPMYWMGQRSPGDTNRAMVWFGEYYYTSGETYEGSEQYKGIKAPILWRTLRSDGEGNYDGAVTLLSEYGLNRIPFDFNTSDSKMYNQFWCTDASGLGSSDLRAFMNGFKTGGMDPDFDKQSKWDQSQGAGYNNEGGGTKEDGGFYNQAFGNTEKSLIIGTELGAEKGILNISSKPVTDKIFALSGTPSANTPEGSGKYDTEVYFGDEIDKKCYPSIFIDSRYAALNLIFAKKGSGRSGEGWWLRTPPYYNDNDTYGWHSSYVSNTGVVSQKAIGSSNHRDGLMARPALNLDPATVVFTPAAKSGVNPNNLNDCPVFGGTYKMEPTDTFTGSDVIGLEESNGASGGAFEMNTFGGVAYGQGACYRVFSRNKEDSGIDIDNGTDDSKIAIAYPANASGQYISALVVDEDGKKWTGRIKKIPNNKKGLVEFSIPQEKIGISENRNVRVYAWREIEETETAFIPNVTQLTVREAPSCQITYSKNGGASGAVTMAAQNVVIGSKFTLRPCTFSKSSANNAQYLKYWQGSDGKCYGEEEILTAKENIDLTAQWTDSTIKIKYNKGEGSGTDVEQYRGKGAKFQLPECMFTPPAGKVFVEWNTESNGSGAKSLPGETVGGENGVTGDLTLFAIYGKKITYDSNGAGKDNITQGFKVGSTTTLKSDNDSFTRDKFKLTGWNTEANGTGIAYELGEEVTTFTDDITLYAQWEGDVYTVSFNSNATGITGSVPDDITPKYYGDEITIPDTNIKWSQHKFEGWTLNAAGTGTVYKKGDKFTIGDDFESTDITLYAKWSNADNYSLTYNLNKPSTVIDADVSGAVPDPDTTCYNDGINTTTKAAAAGVKIKGRKFKGWSENASTPSTAEGLTAPGADVSVAANKTLYAIWGDADPWTVTYDGYKEEGMAELPQDNGYYYDDGFEYKTKARENIQTRNGYTFQGWTKTEDSQNVDYKVGDEITVTGNTTLYSVWKPNTCRVKYERNAPGGSGNAPAEQTGDYGTEFTVAAAPAEMKNPGMVFNGWNTDPNGGEDGEVYIAGGTHTFTDNITLYAQWTASSYEFIFNANGATSGEAPASIRKAFGDTFNMPTSSLLKKQCVFDGWAETEAGGGKTYAANTSVTIDNSFTPGEKNLYAKWKAAPTYELSYKKNAGGDTVTGTLPADKSYYGDGIDNVFNVTDVVPVRKGYKFEGWSETEDGAVKYASGGQITLKKTTTLYAVWTEQNYSLSYYFNGGTDTIYGSLPETETGGPSTTGITAAAQGDLKREKHKFTGWNTKDDGSGKDYAPGASITLNENIKLFAKWQKLEPAKLTYDKNCTNTETLVPDADTGHYDDGISHEAKISGIIPLRPGYTFKGWSTDQNAASDSEGLLNDGDKITVITDTVVYAIWEAGSYKLTYDRNVKENDTDPVQGSWPSEETLNSGENASLHDGTGIIRPHYTLKEWNTSADGSGTVCKLGEEASFTTDTTLYAVWEPETYTITYDGGAGDVTGTIPSEYEGKYKTSFQAASGSGMKREGYVFTGWNDVNAGTGNAFAPGSSYQITGNKRLYAQWSKNVWTIEYNTNGADQGGPIDAVNANVNTTVKLHDGSGLKKQEYTFDGWCTAPDGTSGTSYKAGGDFAVTESTAKKTTLYAKWKKAASYTLTYEANGSGVSGNIPPKVACYDDKINNSTVIPQNEMERKGYTFAGWSETEKGEVKYFSGDTIDMAKVGKDLILYAVWNSESFKLMYEGNADDITGDVPEEVIGNVDSDIRAAEQGGMYRAEHKFTGWNTEADGSGAAILPGAKIKLDEIKVLYAQWKPLEAAHITYYSGCDDSAVDLTLPIDKKKYFDDGISSKGYISTVKPFRHGYEFAYWATQENGGGTTYTGGEEIKVTKDVKLYAIWNMGSYTLTYDGNADDVQGKLPPNKYGTILSTIEAEDHTGFTRPYYTFTGWNTRADGTGAEYQPGDSISLGKDMILYAQWKETVYKVKYDLNSPVISKAEGTLPESVEGTHLEKFTAAQKGDISCKKYKFTGWNTDPDGQGEQFEPGEEYLFKVLENYGDEVTLYANWESVPPYEVVYMGNGDDVTGDVPVDKNLYVPNDGDIAVVLGHGNLKKKGYEFVCWSTKPDGSGNKYVEGSRFTVTAHTVLYAQWTAGTYTLTYDKNGSNVSGKAPASVRRSSQEDIKTAGPNTLKKKNYEFVGWSTVKNASVPTYKEGTKLRITEDTTLYAVWKRLINVILDHTEGLEPVADRVQSVSQGSKLSDIKLPAVKEGYEITGWVVNGKEVTNPNDYVLEEDAEVEVKVEKKEPSKDDPKDSNTNEKDNSNSSKDNKPDKDSSVENGNSDNNSGGDGSDNDGFGNDSMGGQGTGGGLKRRENTTYKAKGIPSDVLLGSSKPDKAGRNASGSTVSGSETGGNEGAISAAGIAGNRMNLHAGAAFAGLPWSKAADCRLHFLILICMLIWLLLTIYWLLHTRKNREDEEENADQEKNEKPSLVFDSIMPMIPFGGCMIFYLIRICPLDVILILVWLAAAVVNLFLTKRSYTKRFAVEEKK